MDKKKTDCEICGKSVSKTNLKRHLSTHETVRKVYKCMFCDKHYLRQDRLSKHLREGNVQEKV